jgi:hypothetical protein
MASPVVIKHLDIIKNICPGGVPAAVDLSLYSLPLQQLEDALSNSIVVVVTIIGDTHELENLLH